MVGRTSSRQAAAKAKQALSKGAAGAKRKGASTESPAPKKGKKDEYKEEVNYQKPVGAEEAEEKGEEKPPMEVWSEEQVVEEEPKGEQVKDLEEKPTEEPEMKPEERQEQVVEEEPKGEQVKDLEEKPTEEPEVKPEERQGQEGETKAADEHQEQAAPSDEKPHEKPSTAPNGVADAVKESPEREAIVPSSVLEKGIIYFFFRPRVNVEEPHSINEIARSFFVTRPTSRGAKLEDGPIGDDSNCRLMMLPKKKYPTSGRERDLAFVEKANVSLSTLRESFITGEKYETKTRGERTVSEAKPFAEGVYAITRTTRSSHLAYILTIPSEVGDVQDNFGLHHKGSFILQSKNPKYPGPPNVRFPKGPEYPEHVLAKFGDLRWVPVEPEFLDYPNAQFLMIGEAQDSLGKGGVAEAGGKEPNQEQPGEELEKLEDENEERVESLQGDHTIYEDLGLDAKQYPQVPTTWDSL